MVSYDMLILSLKLLDSLSTLTDSIGPFEIFASNPAVLIQQKMSSGVQDYAPMLQKLVLCAWITPLDCFWERAKPIGPDPPLSLSVELGLVAYILNTAHDLPVSWSTFKPEEDVKLFKDIADDMGTLASCFETEIRGICDEYQALGIDTFPHGIAFTFWEQYLNLNLNLFNAVGVIMVAVFCVISLLLINPWSASCIMVILILMTVELAGFLGFVGIKLNPVSAVMLITAVGIGVEFTAHVVFAFLTSLGDRNERIAAAIDRLFVPVIHGALSAHLGIVMLAFSEFEFVVKYLFVVMFALIIIGLINGLALLPVLLCLMGPSCD
ncbi:hypothetical protein QR680_001622 [Steinernema hermaphroditum]|uniref:SSD domain-containing protein n=1 Tax=Steinernema hermaphroditum TaxID=289476 RepID=A0AA39GZ34_9BILA|nr:hypothetical protein QR680_001622 [Steinernema hermaphroditum]